MAWEYVVPAVFALLGLCVVLYQRRKRKKAEEVAAGLQIFDSNGNITLDITNASIFIFGTASTGTNAGSIIDSRIKKDSVFIMPYKKRRALRGSNSLIDDEYNDVTGYPVKFEIEDGCISWDWKENGGNLNFDNDYITVIWFSYGGILRG